MRIVIDLEGAQTESRFHGIGRYSFDFSLELARNPRGHEVWLLLNGAFAASAADLRDSFAEFVPPERILTFTPPTGMEFTASPLPPRRAVAAELRAHVLRSADPDCVVVTSVIEPVGGDAISTSADTALDALSAGIVYDLIPVLRPEQYLTDPVTRRHFEAKMAEYERLRLLLCISESSRREVLDTLDVPPERVVAISSAAGDEFSPGPPLAPEALRELGIDRPFVMYAPSGYDPRKNIEGLLTAFAQLPADLRATHQLVLTSKFTEHGIDRVRVAARKAGLHDDELVFTGFVTDAQLVGLYRATELLVYPSLHEGFGLPALEAMACGAPVIGSNRTSVPEIIGDEAAQFDPDSPAEIAAMMTAVLTDDEWRAKLRKAGQQRAAEFSWPRTVGRALDAIEQAFGHREPTTPPSTGRKRIALVSPLPPARSGIARYTEELLPGLREVLDVTLVSDEPAPGFGEVRDAAWLLAHADEFDHVVYQFGNSTFHHFMLPLLRAVPGTVVLHDFYLSGLYRSAKALGMPREWELAVGDAHGDVLSRPSSDTEIEQRYPANRSVLNAAEAVIVHSRHAIDLIEHWYGPTPELAATYVPMPRTEPAPLTRAEARAALGISPDARIVASFGIVHANKQHLEVLRAWLASDAARDPHCELHFVGEALDPTYLATLEEEAAAHPNGARVTVTGWAAPETYAAYLVATDVAVQLRAYSRGESSAAILDCLNHGLPTIVNAHGSSAELPRDTVLMVSDAFTSDELRDAIDSLLSDDAARQDLARAGAALMAGQRPADAARAYAAVLEGVEARRSTHHLGLLRNVAATIPARDSALVADVAQAVARSVRRPVTARQVLVDVTDLPDWPSAEVADELVTSTPASVRVQFVRVDDGGRLVTLDGYPRSLPEGAAPSAADIRSGDVLLLANPATTNDPVRRRAYRSAQGRGASLAVAAPTTRHLLAAAELLGPRDAGAFCGSDDDTAMAERALAGRPITIHTVHDRDVRAGAVRQLAEDGSR